MSMNIKNPEAHRLAQELAAATGESLTDAVIVALRERLARLIPEQPAGQDQRLEKMLQIMRRTAPLMADGPSSTEIGAFLYDEKTGMPR